MMPPVHNYVLSLIMYYVPNVNQYCGRNLANNVHSVILLSTILRECLWIPKFDILKLSNNARHFPAKQHVSFVLIHVNES